MKLPALSIGVQRDKSRFACNDGISAHGCKRGESECKCKFTNACCSKDQSCKCMLGVATCHS